MTEPLRAPNDEKVAELVGIAIKKVIEMDLVLQLLEGIEGFLIMMVILKCMGKQMILILVM